MPVVLKFQSTGAIPGSGEPINMVGESLTLGRGPGNDVVLPDPDRVLSKRHCAIEDHNGNVIVVDFSTNGTFLNYGKLPLGATPTPLNDGDILCIGPYEILVSIGAAQPQNTLADPLEDLPVSPGFAAQAPSTADLLDAPGDAGDFLDDLLSGRDAPQGPDGIEREELGEDGLLPPLGEEDGILPPAEDPFAGQGASFGAHSPSAQDHFATPSVSTGGGSTIPDDWDDDFLSPSAAPAAPAVPGNAQDPFAQSSAPIADPIPAALPEPSEPAPQMTAPPTELPEVAPAPAPTAAPVQTPPIGADGSDHAAARAFLKALGAEDVPIKDEEMKATMAQMGRVARVMIEGMREILMTRTNIKSEFRIEQTMIKAGGNNPLKFSVTPDQAIEAMVKPKAKGYLDAADAAAQALQDIKAHEVATITGMEAALKGILAKLNPEVLESKIAGTAAFSSMLKSRKARYWELYEEKYAEISDQAENDFHDLFAKEFARAYQEQMNKLKSTRSSRGTD